MRQTLRQTTTQSAQKLIAQTNEIRRLKALNAGTGTCLAELESGRVTIARGRKLIEFSEADHSRCGAEQRFWCLDKAIRAAHGEYQQLSSRRDAVAF